MKKSILSLAVIIIVMAACQQTEHTDITSAEYQSEVKEEIAKFNKLYYEAWGNEDIDSVMYFLDEGFVNMFGFGMSLSKEESRDGFADVFDSYSIEDVEFKTIEVIADHNYAFETLFFKQKWITNDNQDTIVFDIRVMTVFKNQDDGSWKMFRHFAQNFDLNSL